MNEARQLVASMVESGDYFGDARKWYYDKYLFPFTQRIYLFLISFVMLCFAFMILNLAISDYIKKKIPFPIYFEDQIQFFSQIHSLSKGDEPVAISIARYLASEYVKAREGYDYSVLNNSVTREELFKKIRNLSSRRVFSKYANYISISTNPESPIILYKDLTKRLINIQKTVFSEEANDRPEFIKVYFEAIEKNDISETKSNWVATINFTMSDINNVIDDKLSLQFVVINYETAKVMKINN